jgi:hypothetical protein
MATKIVSRTPDVIRKVEVVLLQDDFGARVTIEHKMLNPDYDAAAKEAEVMQQMDANAAVCEQKLTARGHNPEDFKKKDK